MKRGLEKETYRLLKRSSDLVIARLKESDQMEDEGFFFYLSNFSIFGLAGISTFRELVDIIDPHGEICEGKGYRQYQEELLKTMHRSEENHKKLSFLLPILNQDKRFNLLLDTSYDEETDSRIFIISYVSVSGVDLNLFLHASFKDRLTGLFNYSVLQDHLRKNDTESYLCLFDFNNFKLINDTYGHSFGDLVLQDLAQYLIHISCIGIIFYRRSGDEFFFLAQDGKEKALDFLYQIEDHLGTLTQDKFKDYQFSLSAAFGMVHLEYGENGAFNLSNNLQAIRLADYAMYQAKASHQRLRLIETKEAKTLLNDRDIEQKIHSLISQIRR